MGTTKQEQEVNGNDLRGSHFIYMIVYVYYDKIRTIHPLRTIHVEKFMAIHLIAVETFYSRPDVGA